MDLYLRLGVVVALVAVGAIITLVYRRRSAADEALGATDAATGASLWPDLPDALHDHDARPHATWVIFTTPLCASCSAVQAELERNFPHHRVLKVDATEQPEIADLYEVRRAPTTIVADVTGRIVERFVGPEAVREFVGTAEDPALLL